MIKLLRLVIYESYNFFSFFRDKYSVDAAMSVLALFTAMNLLTLIGFLLLLQDMSLSREIIIVVILVFMGLCLYVIGPRIDFNSLELEFSSIPKFQRVLIAVSYLLASFALYMSLNFI